MRAPQLTAAEIEALPALLAVKDLARIWRISINRAHDLDREGAWDFLLVKPAVGPLKFSGHRLQRYLRCDDLRGAARLPKASGW